MTQPLYDRLNHELEAMHEELCQAKSDLSQTREELVHNSAHREKISSQVMLFAGKTFHQHSSC